jgi:hypothetical protein
VGQPLSAEDAGLNVGLKVVVVALGVCAVGLLPLSPLASLALLLVMWISWQGSKK